MAQSSLTFNTHARRTLSTLTPSQHTTIHLTIASSSLEDLLTTYIGHARKANLSPIVVGAVDASMLSICDERFSLPAVADNATALGAKWQYFRHHHDFLRFGSLKVKLILELLQPGFSVLLSDLDVIWLSSHWRAWMLPPSPTDDDDDAALLLPEARLLHFADVLVSTDELDAGLDAADTSRGPGDVGWLGFGMRTDLNTGIQFWRGASAGALSARHVQPHALHTLPHAHAMPPPPLWPCMHACAPLPSPYLPMRRSARQAHHCSGS